MNAKPSVVIDTQLLLRAAVNPISLPGKLIFDLRTSYELVFSPGTLAEAQDVLNRPKVRAKFPGLTNAAVEKTLGVFSSARQVLPEETPAVSRDPKDDIFLATAVEAGVQYLVTEDQDLLVMNPYQGIRIVNALDFLNALRPSSAPETSAPPQSE